MYKLINKFNYKLTFVNKIIICNNKIIINSQRDHLNQMNKYFSLSPSNKTQIHNLLSPIFEAVRKNRIHSYYQLQKKDQNNQAIVQPQQKNKHYIFQPKPKTAQVIHQPLPTQFSKRARLTHQTLYSPMPQNIQPQTASIQFSRSSKNQSKMTTTLSKQRKKPDQQIKNPNQKRSPNKMFRVNSKIKKHLVEQINFDEIEKMFYKKRQTMTRYQYFLKNKNKNRSLSQKVDKLYRPKFQRQAQCIKIKDVNNGDSIDKEQFNDKSLKNYLHQQFATMPVKSCPRKKFWVKQAAKKEIKINSQYPIIEGTAMRTLQV